jgi:hypothetical protein
MARPYTTRAGVDRDGQRALVWGLLRQEREPLTIAFTGFNQSYPLYGSDLHHRVHYVAIDGRQGFNLHDYLPLLDGRSGLTARRTYKPAYYRQQPDEALWLHGIETLGVDILIVSRFSSWDRQEFEHDEEGFPWEETWALENPARFSQILKTPDIRVYRVVRQQSGAPKGGSSGADRRTTRPVEGKR